MRVPHNRVREIAQKGIPHAVPVPMRIPSRESGRLEEVIRFVVHIKERGENGGLIYSPDGIYARQATVSLGIAEGIIAYCKQRLETGLQTDLCLALEHEGDRFIVRPCMDTHTPLFSSYHQAAHA